MMGIGMTHDPIEIGVISPDMMPTKALGAGEVGYVITGRRTSASQGGRHHHLRHKSGYRAARRLP